MNELSERFELCKKSYSDLFIMVEKSLGNEAITNEIVDLNEEIIKKMADSQNILKELLAVYNSTDKNSIDPELDKGIKQFIELLEKRIKSAISGIDFKYNCLDQERQEMLKDINVNNNKSKGAKGYLKAVNNKPTSFKNNI